VIRAHTNLANPEERAIAQIDQLEQIADSLKRLVDGLEAGTFSIRTHHPLCMTPKNLDLTVADIEAVSRFVDASITAGTLALPSKRPGGGS
jgi:hypothetical protein